MAWLLKAIGWDTAESKMSTGKSQHVYTILAESDR